MYKNNSRESSKFNVCSPLQLHRKLKVWSSSIGYYSYTYRWVVIEKKDFSNKESSIIFVEKELE